MPDNFYMLFVAALIPLLVGSVYYHPKVLGNAWMKANGFTEESMKGANMAVIFGLTFLLSLMLAFMLQSLVIHQGAVYGLFMPEMMDANSQLAGELQDFMNKYGDRHRTFSHGAVHGIFLSIFFVLPLIGINALFERRGAKYIFIHFGYWLISLILMGGLLCSVLKYSF